MNEIGNKIYQRRKELGLTLEEVGNAVGVGKSTVRRWENGMIKNMGRDKIAALARVLKMNPVEFVPMEPIELVKVESRYEYKHEDYDDMMRLEALHQNPKLRLLFDIQKNLDDSDLNAVLGVVNAIAKERGDDV